MTKFKKSIRHVLQPDDLKYCHCFQWPKLYAVAKYGCDSNILKPFSCNKGRQTAYVWRHELLVEVEASKMRWFGTFHGNNMVIKSPHLIKMRWFFSSNDCDRVIFYYSTRPCAIISVDCWQLFNGFHSNRTIKCKKRYGGGIDRRQKANTELTTLCCIASIEASCSGSSNLVHLI